MVNDGTRRTIFGILGLYLTFTFINIDPALATAFAFITLFDFILLITDKAVTFPFERSKEGRFQSLLWGAAAWVAFTYASITALTFTQLAVAATFQSVIALQAQVQPFFQGSPIFEFITFAIVIPVVESNFFFGTLYEFFKDSLKVQISITDIKTHALMLFISALWVAFHITAKSTALQQGIAQFSANLTVVFVFGYASLLLVTYFSQTREAIGLHIIANGAAILKKMGVI